jgi:predicted DNA-binding ribbon-helix-helix protein
LTGHFDLRVARKYSVTIAGHETSIRIEPAFWEVVLSVANRQHIPVNALIARIDSLRVATRPTPNLASAIRLWALSEIAACEACNPEA